ncbi:collagen alpha-5(VI) chain-like [Mytilus galloprovincialis]|uniref:collagen alpha-5(VI) chain-like n=1 Tax=Mytilus galloprovincialis TaxID=29158 RepID=UPI003F7BD560
MCKPYPSDVVFVLDNSMSMGNVYFTLQKEYLINLTNDWIIDEEHFQIAIITFSDVSVVQYDFGIISNNTDFSDKLSNIGFKGSISQLHLGIAEGVNLLSKRERRIHLMKAKKYLIIISDGLLSTPRDLQAVTSEDIETDIVAFGEDVSHYYLSKITGNMTGVFPPTSDRLWYHMMADLIHPFCNVCHESNETDLMIAVDVSQDMDTTDLTTVIPSLMIKLLNMIGLENTDLRLSLVNFADQVDVRFTNQTYLNETQSRTIQRMSYLPRENTKVANFSDILDYVVDLSNDTDNGARFSAKKIILFISEFKFNIDEKSKDITRKLMSDSSEIFTIGLNLEEESFQNMLDISSSSFHVGTVGDMFANQIDTFIEAFVNQLSYVKCTVN